MLGFVAVKRIGNVVKITLIKDIVVYIIQHVNIPVVIIPASSTILKVSVLDMKIHYIFRVGKVPGDLLGISYPEQGFISTIEFSSTGSRSLSLDGGFNHS